MVATMKYQHAYLQPRLRWALPLALTLGAAVTFSACEVPDSAGPTPVPEQNMLFSGDVDADADAGCD